MRATEVTGDLARISVTAAEHVLHQELDGEMVLLDLQTGGYYGLNEVGSRIWLAFQEGQKPDEIVRLLMGEYEVSRETMEQDMRAFLTSLEAQGLVSVREDPA